MLFTLRGIGEELFNCGGTRLTRTVLAEVAAFDAEYESRRLSPADAKWDGNRRRRGYVDSLSFIGRTGEEPCFMAQHYLLFA
jgi:hypothetical protein